MADSESTRTSRIYLLLVITALAVTSFFYRLLVMRKLEQTSALFIGIPTVLAFIVAFTPSTKSVTGGIMKAMTLGLLMSGILLGEGFICILMAAPLFYLVGAVVGLIIGTSQKKNRTTMNCVALLLLLPMALEGTTQWSSFARDEAVVAEEIVNAPESEVVVALAKSPRVDGKLPAFLRLRFPRATWARGEGLQTGDVRTIHFAGGEGHPGELEMRVKEREANSVVFEAVSDHSKIAHWLDWRYARVEWTPVDDQHTRVRWELGFRRDLDPAWYFGPWERYAVRLAAQYLIENNATPEAR